MVVALTRDELYQLDASPPFRAVQALCERAEREIRLIDRAEPLNAATERGRLSGELAAGRRAVPELAYAAPPELSGLRRELEVAALALAAFGPLGALYAARARELACEASLAEAIGSAGLVARAAVRFPLERGPDGDFAERWAAEHTRTFAATSPGAHYSDDVRDPLSLVSLLRRRVSELGLSVRVEVRERQTAAAVVGDGFVAVRAGQRQGANEVARIALHELEGHALPRQRAQSERLALFRVGSAASSDDEEGRALWLEQQAGLCDEARCAELALRHVLARAAREGHAFADVCAELCARGAQPERLIDAALRAYRGGGLGRELVYLAALSRVSRAFAEQPSLAAWLARGRVSVSAARTLMSHVV